MVTPVYKLDTLLARSGRLWISLYSFVYLDNPMGFILTNKLRRLLHGNTLLARSSSLYIDYLSYGIRPSFWRYTNRIKHHIYTNTSLYKIPGAITNKSFCQVLQDLLTNYFYLLTITLEILIRAINSNSLGYWIWIMLRSVRLYNSKHMCQVIHGGCRHEVDNLSGSFF